MEEDIRKIWASARRWLTVWAGAGFTGRVEGEKIFMPAGWAEKFPDGPMVLSALRTEIFALIRDGNKAMPPRNDQVNAYREQVEGMIADETNRLGHAEKCVRDSLKRIKELREELDSL